MNLFDETNVSPQCSVSHPLNTNTIKLIKQWEEYLKELKKMLIIQGISVDPQKEYTLVHGIMD